MIKHRERLREGLRFNRWFFVTYQPVIVLIVALVALRQCHIRWSRRRRRQRTRLAGTTKKRETRDEHESRPRLLSERYTSSSSGSSSRSVSTGETPVEGVVANSKSMDEYSPLLANDTESSRARPSGSPLLRLKALLMYQPAPIPCIGRTMPSLGSCLGVAVLLGLNLFYLLFQCVDSTDVLADRAGLMFVANLPWLNVLGAKTQPLKWLTGHSYENINLLHRRLGEYMCLLAAVHTAGMLLAWYNFLRPLGYTLIRFITLRYILFGVGALICYESLYFSSLASFRAWWYEMFLGTHIALQAGALVLLYLHHYNSRPYVLAALAVFAFDRLFTRLTWNTQTVPADLLVLPDGATTLVSCKVLQRHQKRGIQRALAPAVLRDGWQPSAHVFISIPALGRKHAYQSHPITISSAAPLRDTNEYPSTHDLALLIRAQQGFSRDLLRFAHNNRTVDVRLTGPYGSLHALELLGASDLALFVAAGSGIAVAWPLVWALAAELRDQTQDAGSHQRAHVFPRIHLIWIVQEESHWTWLGEDRLASLREIGVTCTLPTPTRKAGVRPNVADLVRSVVEDECPVGPAGRIRAGEDVLVRGKVGVVVSGPDSLNRAVRNECARLTWAGWDTETMIEKFGW